MHGAHTCHGTAHIGCPWHSPYPLCQTKVSARQVMEEVIAKSKAAKAARQMLKEEDLTATDILDASFTSLLQTGALVPLMKEKGARHDRNAAQTVQDEGDAEFDRMRRELGFESRAKVTTMTHARLHICHRFRAACLAVPARGCHSILDILMTWLRSY